MARNTYQASAGLSRRRTLLATMTLVALAGSLLSALPAYAQDGSAVALVNGQPISRQELVDILIDARGVEVLQEMVILQLAKQEAHKRGLKVRRADIDAEFQRALDRIASEAGMNPDEATEKNKRQALQQVLDKRGFSMSEFMLSMERNAYLRKIVEHDIHITPETLHEEFARTYGDKVVVRDIQIPQRDSRTLNEAMDLLRRGADFADVARRLSKNPVTAARGGEMEPFTFNDPNIPAALREGAFSLKPGGITSPILTGQYFHILKLERRIPQRSVRFEDVRDKIEQQVRERAIPQAMSRLAKDLFTQARIRVLDSRLRQKYQEFLKQSAQAGG